MADKTEISWADSTFNPWIGCQKVSSGCDHCYAETQNNHRKWNGGEWGPHAPRKRTSAGYWKQPLSWQKNAAIFYAQHGRRRSVFCASLADVFDNKAPEGALADLWRLIWETPDLNWLLLTKRPENIADCLPESWSTHAAEWAHVALGITAEDQPNYDRRWPILQKIPCATRFVSYEPACGPLTIARGTGKYPDWLICGGESGSGYREMPVEWAGDIMGECSATGVAFFMKQMAAKKPIPWWLMKREFPERLAA